MNEVTAVQYGVGPIGSRIVRAAHKRDIRFAGAIDIDPEKVGRDLGDIAGLNDQLAVEVSNEPTAVLNADVDIVFHSTVSDLEVALPQLRECLEAGANVLSTCEQLTYPKYRHPDLAIELDRLAARCDVSIMGTGINPGFAMDFLPTVLTTPCHEIDSIEVLRVQNASTRREPLQRKVGAGLTVEEFESAILGNEGHVGLTESIAMIAGALGWDIDDITEGSEPVIADEPVTTEYVDVEPGQVAGMTQHGVGLVDGEEHLSLEISQYVGASDPRDQVQIEGDPDLTMQIPGGIHGDTATPAILVNSANRVINADPGLRTMIGEIQR